MKGIARLVFRYRGDCTVPFVWAPWPEAGSGHADHTGDGGRSRLYCITFVDRLDRGVDMLTTLDMVFIVDCIVTFVWLLDQKRREWTC